MKLFILPLLFGSLSAQAFTLGLANGSALQGWQNTELVFRLNASNCGSATSTVTAAMQDAVDVWNGIPNSKLELKYGGSTTTTVAAATAFTATDLPVVICDPNFNTTTGQAGDNGVMGVGQFQTVNLVIRGGYVLLNADTTNSPTRNITTMNATQIAIVLAHEMGHVLGLGHSTEEPALMYFSTGTKAALRLSQDDMDGIAYLYPRSEPSDGVFGCGTLTVGGGPNPPSPWMAPMLFLIWFLLIPYLSTRNLKSSTLRNRANSF